MHIVIAEDNLDHQELVLDMLRDCFGLRLQYRMFARLEEALNHLQQHHADIFLCDLKLPDSTIEQTVDRIRSLEEAPPIIVLTSLHDDELAQRLVKMGIQDFLPKDELTQAQLQRACNYAIERKKLTRSLLEKNEDYKAFCYSLTHDFKSSLWQISRYAQIFKQETQKQYPENSSLPFDFLDRITSRVNTIQNLIIDLQDYLSIDVMMDSFGETSLRLAVNSAIDMQQELLEQRHAKVTLEELPNIIGNQTQLQLLFSNLISNAVKYNDKPVPEVRISCHQQDVECCTLCVADNGIGIDADMIGRIFTPFERLHREDQYPGSGLGLSIVKRIMQSHGGKVSVTSEPGAGTRFWLRFPVASPPNT